MKVGVIVDGQAEPDAMVLLWRKLRGVGSILRPVYVDIQPKAAPALIARRASSHIGVLRKRGAGTVVVLLDREDRRECCPEFSRLVAEALAALGHRGVVVVIKDRCLENWLIADPSGLAKLQGRFSPTRGLAGRVSPNKADNVTNAQAILARMTVGDAYHKRHDPPHIFGAMDVAAAAKNSRSFRRFLRAVGDARYRSQSKQP